MESEESSRVGVNYTPPSTPPSSSLFEVKQVVVELWTLLTLLSKDCADYKADYKAVRALLDELVAVFEGYNRGYYIKGVDGVDADNNNNEEISENMCEDQPILDTLFNIAPSLAKLRASLNDNPDHPLITPATPLVQCVASDLSKVDQFVDELNISGVTREIKLRPGYYSWLSTLPPGFVYHGCIPNHTGSMAESVKTQLVSWGYKVNDRGEWCKPYWWILCDFDYEIKRMCAVERLLWRKEGGACNSAGYRFTVGSKIGIA
jgi:hypothetical protein